MTTICLCMIVRNEAAVIERCLASVRDIIDRWVIVDTGSTDGTQALIRQCLQGVPGELHERRWVDFGHNRSELMALAHGVADYLLLIDADMTVQCDGRVDGLTADAYLVRQGDASFDYRNIRLVNGSLRWRYVGSTHEYIDLIDGEPGKESLDVIRIVDHGDGGSKADKFVRDRRLLEVELERDPENPRARFYLAQTCRDLALQEEDEAMLALAAGYYQRRADMPGWLEETYVAQFQAGALLTRLGRWPEAMEAFTRAWEQRPERLEAAHALAAGLRERRRFRTAHRLTSMVADLEPLPVPEDVLFVEPWVYEWGMLFEYSITAYWVGEYERSVAACTRLLERHRLPDEYRVLTEGNLQHALRRRDGQGE